jgi:hypothetical protein
MTEHLARLGWRDQRRELFQRENETMIHHIFFLHGKGGSSNGTIRILRDALLPCLNDPPQIALLEFPSGTADEYFAAILAVAAKFPAASE